MAISSRSQPFHVKRRRDATQVLGFVENLGAFAIERIGEPFRVKRLRQARRGWTGCRDGRGRRGSREAR
jgi:hypothetical protein